MVADSLNTAKSLALLARSWLGKPWIRVLLGITCGLLAGYWVVRDLHWASLGDQLKNLPVRYALGSFGIVALSVAVRAYRWQLLFVGQKIPLLRLFLVQNTGIGLNSVVPGLFLGEAVQFVLLTLRCQVKKEVAVTTLGFQRLLDFVISVSLLAIGLLMLPRLHGFTPYVLGAGVVAVASVLAVPAVIWLGARPGLIRVPLLASTANSVLALVRAKINVTSAFLLTLAYWLLVGLAAWVLAYGMGIQISLLVATLVIIATLTFATMIPALPGAVGTFEFALYYLLKPFEVAQPAALGFAVVIHIMLFLPPILIGLLTSSGWVLGPRSPDEIGAPSGGDLAVEQIPPTPVKGERPG
jgi:hypothetical protein